MYVMGVINSRRLGKSLGLDIIGADGVKRCNFNCVYCEVGNGRYETERGVYADFDEAMTELKEAYSSDIDVITFSGNGEPTLNQEIGKYIDAIHAFCDAPVCVITNSTLLQEEAVQADLMKADIVMPSIDAISEEVFQKVDRPLKVDLETVKASIKDFSNKYQGKLYLEILFVKGINDSKEELQLLKEFVLEVGPTELHINTVDRVPAEELEFYSNEEKVFLHDFFSDINVNVRLF